MLYKLHSIMSKLAGKFRRTKKNVLIDSRHVYLQFLQVRGDMRISLYTISLLFSMFFMFFDLKLALFSMFFCIFWHFFMHVFSKMPVGSLLLVQPVLGNVV